MKTFTPLLVAACLFIAANTNAQQYCMLAGRTSYSTNQPGITNFKLNGIDRTSAAVENALSAPPVVETGDSTKLERGKTYTVSITHSVDALYFPNARNNIRIWIDYNQDFDFTGTDETVVTKDLETAGTTYTTTFTVPMDAKLGPTMLRATAKMSADAGHTIPTPCDNPPDPIDYHGEMEDYKVTIVESGTAVNEIAANSIETHIYPNPATNAITVELKDNTRREQLSIGLYDITGKQIATLLEEAKQTNTKYSFNLNNYAATPGIYFIKVTAGDATSYEKVVKTN